MMKTAKQKNKNQAGFTLVELMIAITILGIVLVTIMATYQSQQTNRKIQSQVAEMQQNIRSAMIDLTRAIREAGSDAKFVSGAGISVATAGRIQLSRDIAGHPINPNEADGDIGDPLENLIYCLDPAVDTNAQQDGVPDAAQTATLCRNNINDGTNTFQPIAEGIERLEFNYLDENGITIPAPITSWSDINRIVAVQVSILARASAPDLTRRYLNTLTYTSAAGTVWGPFNDSFRRRISVTTIECRNS